MLLLKRLSVLLLLLVCGKRASACVLGLLLWQYGRYSNECLLCYDLGSSWR
jgi:hypothetical protein